MLMLFLTVRMHIHMQCSQQSQWNLSCCHFSSPLYNSPTQEDVQSLEELWTYKGFTQSYAVVGNQLHPLKGAVTAYGSITRT